MLKDHPLVVIDKIIKTAHDRGEELEFGFESFSFDPDKYNNDDDQSVYEWHDDAGFNGKEVLERSNDLADFFHKAAVNNRDVTITSDVRLFVGKLEKKLYLPQIDFCCHPGYNEINRRDDIKAPVDATRLEFFNSGRSMHAYGLDLMEQHEWLKFLGNVLLMNQVGIGVSDSRWVGHSLCRGYSALRLTSNNDKYLAVPSAMPNPFLNEPWKGVAPRAATIEDAVVF